MNKTTKYVLAVAGIIGTVLGLVGAVPGFLQENYVLATLSAILMVAGLVLLAISFGD
jgi:hypothetical protein